MKSGKKAEVPVAGMFELDDAGKVKVWRDYFDLATFTRQISQPACLAEEGTL
jgi:limonene-1,2-epoxide hydrolase